MKSNTVLNNVNRKKWYTGIWGLSYICWLSTSIYYQKQSFCPQQKQSVTILYLADIYNSCGYSTHQKDADDIQHQYE